jgi:hypothetical protein
MATRNPRSPNHGIAGMMAITFILYMVRFSFGWRAEIGPAGAELHETIQAWSWMLGGALTFVLVMWSSLNAWGLAKRSRAARYSSIAYAAATLAMCCFAPFSGFLLYLLLRSDVKAAFSRRA